MLAKDLFFDLVNKVEQIGQFTHILEQQKTKYQLQPFKLQGVDCKAIRRIYEALQTKYYETKQLAEDPHNWNQNERRVFIWYIIFYTYFLVENNESLTSEHWAKLSTIFFNKRQEFLHFQYLSMIKCGKISWTEEEDQLLIQSVQHQGPGKWNEVVKYFFFKSNFQLFKSSKHCRERWLNHLDDKKKHGNWTPQQDLIIFNYVSEYGKRWCKLVPLLNDRRTEHMIKNRFNSLINKQRSSKKQREQVSVTKIRKLLKKQIDNSQKKKQKKEEQEMIKLLTSQKMQKIDEEQKDEKKFQKPIVKSEEVLDATLEHKIVKSQKTSSVENVKESTIKEESEVDYILHEMQEDKSKSNESQNTLKIKAQQQKQVKNAFEEDKLAYQIQYNNYPFINPYTGLGYLPAYSYYWF